MKEIIHIILHSIEHSFIDSLKTLPFLFGAYLLIEFLDHKAADKLPAILKKMGRFGPIGGAALGCIPQCGFSVAASNLYSGRLITVGTLVAVFLSTSDEAVPILVSNPEKIGMILWLILIKVVLAVIAGFVMDFAVKCANKNEYNFDTKPCEEICSDCDCKHNGIFKSAIHHTIGIFIFILIINIILHILIKLIGEDTISGALMQIRWIQPVIAGLVGLIPNCAASVVLTELYIKGGLTFGSLIAGLSSGAGLGIAVLFKTNKHFKQNIIITLSVLLFGIGAGFIVDLIAMI